MTCIERIKLECKNRHIPISRLEKDCGFANGYIGKLKEGTMPADRLLQVSHYLNMSYEYLITGNASFLIYAEERDLVISYRNADDTTKKIIRKILDID